MTNEGEQPVAGPQPVPLPLPPRAGGVPRGGSQGRRTALIVAGIVFGVLVLCGVAWWGGSALFGDVFAGLDSYGAGARQLAWSGNGRYAIVEYMSAGKDATSTVVSWDSQTGKVRTLPGYRLVATEPSSTQVWVTEAPPETQTNPLADPPLPTIAGDNESPWSYPGSQGMLYDGPGTAWSWDAAVGGKPDRRTSPEWTPWAGPDGTIARLSVWPSVGLWPFDVEFERPDGEIVYPDVPQDFGTFLPVGWSPSGRYFALRGSDGVPLIVILDSQTGAVVAEYDVQGSGDSYTEAGGAAWDPKQDLLWIPTTEYLPSESESGDESSVVSVVALSVEGSATPVQSPPKSWSATWSTPTVLGRDDTGVLIAVEGESGLGIWRLTTSGVQSCPVPDALTASQLTEGSFMPGRGFLSIDWNDDALGAELPSASLVRIPSHEIVQLWPRAKGK